MRQRYRAGMETEHHKLEEANLQLQAALDEVKTLSGMIPICSHCHKIRDDQEFWDRLESYLSKHSGAQFSHGICPDCIKELYPDFDNQPKAKSGASGSD